MSFFSLSKFVSKKLTIEPENSNSTVIDSLFMELEHQIKKLEDQGKNKNKKKKIKTLSVDYSWLMTKNVKHFEISQSDREDLREYFKQVLPSERLRVIILFRNGLILEKDPKKLVNIMKFSIKQVFTERPKEEIIGLRRHKSFWKLMKYMPSARVTPAVTKTELNQSKSCGSLQL